VSGGEMQCGEFILSLLINPLLKLSSILLSDLCIISENLLPSILKQNFKAIGVVSVGSVGQHAEIPRILHSCQVYAGFLEAEILKETIVILVSNITENIQRFYPIHNHSWSIFNFARFTDGEVVGEVRNIHQTQIVSVIRVLIAISCFLQHCISDFSVTKGNGVVSGVHTKEL